MTADDDTPRWRQRELAECRLGEELDRRNKGTGATPEEVRQHEARILANKLKRALDAYRRPD